MENQNSIQQYGTKFFYDKFELDLITNELTRLQLARQEQIKPEVLKEWINGFVELKLSAISVCKRIKWVRNNVFKDKIKFIDFIKADIIPEPKSMLKSDSKPEITGAEALQRVIKASSKEYDREFKSIREIVEWKTRQNELLKQR